MAKSADKKEFTFINLSDELKSNRKKMLKESGIKLSKEEKAKLKEEPTQIACVYDFIGDVDAKSAEDLAQVINIVTADASKYSDFFLKIRSGGGTVNGYGFASAEIKRLKQAGIKVTVLVDRVAASGGYMMACVADTVIASPNAYVGSIGVVTEIPNINKLLSDKGVKVFELTAGDNKRSLSVIGEPSDEKKAHVQCKLEDIHSYFIDHVTENRKPLAELSEGMASKVFSGDYWTAQESVDNNYGLVDQIKTSEAFFMEASKSRTLIEIKVGKKKKGLLRKLIGADAESLVKVFADSIHERVMNEITVNKSKYL